MTKPSLEELYSSFTRESAEAGRQETEDNYRSMKNEREHKFKEGMNIGRVMPAKRGESLPWIVVYKHQIAVPGLKYKVQFVCPRVHARRKCHTCVRATELAASTNKIDQDRGKSISASPNVFANMFFRDRLELGVKPTRLPWTVYKFLDKLRLEMDFDFTDPHSGIDVLVHRVGTGVDDTEYTPNNDPKGPRPIAETEDEMIDLLMQSQSLRGYAEVLSDKEIEALFTGEKKFGSQTVQLPSGGLAGVIGAPKTPTQTPVQVKTDQFRKPGVSRAQRPVPPPPPPMEEPAEGDVVDGVPDDSDDLPY